MHYCWLHQLSDPLAVCVLFWILNFWILVCKISQNKPIDNNVSFWEHFILRKFYFGKMKSAIGPCTARSRFCFDGSLLSPRFFWNKAGNEVSYWTKYISFNFIHFRFDIFLEGRRSEVKVCSLIPLLTASARRPMYPTPCL